MNELALFAGAGGGILGGHLLGWRTVCAVEWEQYPASVLCARQNDGLLPPFPIWDDVQTFDGKPWRGIVDVVSGGFPCQDISAAGKGAGITGDRSSMWGHMARIIGEVQPQYAFVENSPMLTVRGLGVVLGDLAEMGFDARWCVLGADSVGAPHKRDRIWILATNSRGIGRNIWSSDRQERHVLHDINGDATQSQSTGEGRKCWISEVSTNVANSNCIGLDESKTEWDRFGEQQICENQPNNRSEIWGKTVGCNQFRYEKEMVNTSSEDVERQRKISIGIKSQLRNIGNASWWKFESNICRVANGVASRVDRLKAIGNGQVPLCAATAWRILNEL